MRTMIAAAALAFALVTQAGCTDDGDEQMPAWLSEAIADQQAGRGHRVMIEACTFDSKRAYLFTRLDVVEASDADTLYGKDGQPLCRFGAFVPPGAANPCDRKKLTCHKTLHDSERRAGARSSERYT